jgi:tRNA pseudouridine38-40 synthase
MWKYAAVFSYLGRSYCGWQKQKGSAADGQPSIQGTIEVALQKMTGETINIVGSGRTDSGVHAVGQVVHFILKSKEWDPRILLRGLNGILPMNIRVISVQPVVMDFHAQRSAERKQYSYYFQQGPCPLPHLEPLSWWIQKKLDLEKMSEALSHLVGEHDFKPFQASGAKPGPTVRKILEAEITLESVSFPQSPWHLSDIENRPMCLVRVRVVGTGFLKQMVRGIAGTLLQVGEGRRPSSCTQEILRSLDRSSVGPTAPARALWLERVWYPKHFDLC